MAHPMTGRRRAIERRVTTDFARDRLARALFDVVTDGLELGPAALHSAADREWIRLAIAEPIRHAAEASLDRLADELDASVVSRRPDLADSLLGRSPRPVARERRLVPA
jgi:hypothetical protein